MGKAFKPNWASAPGSTINDLLEERKISFVDFCQHMNLDKAQADKLIYGELRITHDIAVSLEKLFSITANFWRRRERQYRASLKRVEANKKKLEKNKTCGLPKV